MSGKDNFTMPISPEYAEGHKRIFGERERPTGERRVFVSRCAKCEGAVHEGKTLLWDCAKCGGRDCFGLVDASTAPAIQEPRASLDGIATGRFYENTCTDTGVDIGSREKHREYMRVHGLTNPSDYTESWAKAEAERAKIRNGEPIMDRERRETIGKLEYEISKRRK